jgi:hypothetical protein
VTSFLLDTFGIVGGVLALFALLALIDHLAAEDSFFGALGDWRKTARAQRRNAERREVERWSE